VYRAKVHGHIAGVCKCGALVIVKRQWVAIGTVLRAILGKVDIVVGGCVNGNIGVYWWRGR